MADYTEILKLLEEKKNLFIEYENVTHQVLQADADTIGDYITQRDELAIKIDAVTGEINLLCEKEENGGVLQQTAASQIDYEKVPHEMKAVYEAAGQFRSVAFRIKGMEPQIFERLESFKEEALKKMKEKQNMPRIKQYLNNLSDKESNITIGEKNV